MDENHKIIDEKLALAKKKWEEEEKAKTPEQKTQEATIKLQENEKRDAFEKEIIFPSNHDKYLLYPNISFIHQQNSHLADFKINITSVCGAFSALYGYYILNEIDTSKLNKPLDPMKESGVMKEIRDFGYYNKVDDDKNIWWETDASPSVILSNPKYFSTVNKHIDYITFIKYLSANPHGIKNSIILITQPDTKSDKSFTFCVVEKSNIFYLIDTSPRARVNPLIKDMISIRENTPVDNRFEYKGIYCAFPNVKDLDTFIQEHYTYKDLSVYSNVLSENQSLLKIGGDVEVSTAFYCILGNPTVLLFAIICLLVIYLIYLIFMLNKSYCNCNQIL